MGHYDSNWHGMTMCAECDKVIPQELALVKKYHDEGRQEKEEHFCGSNCHDQWDLNRLRTGQ
jgi:hypothetical protein